MYARNKRDVRKNHKKDRGNMKFLLLVKNKNKQINRVKTILINHIWINHDKENCFVCTIIKN